MDRAAAGGAASRRRAYSCATPRPYNDVDCYLEDLVEGELRARAGGQRRGAIARLRCIAHPLRPLPYSSSVIRLRAGQLVVNPGSVGIQAYEGHDPGPHRGGDRLTPRAAMPSSKAPPKGWQADLIAVPYDWDEAAVLAAAQRAGGLGACARDGFCPLGRPGCPCPRRKARRR